MSEQLTIRNVQSKIFDYMETVAFFDRGRGLSLEDRWILYLVGLSDVLKSNLDDKI